MSDCIKDFRSEWFEYNPVSNTMIATHTRLVGHRHNNGNFYIGEADSNADVTIYIRSIETGNTLKFKYLGGNEYDTYNALYCWIFAPCVPNEDSFLKKLRVIIYPNQ